MGVYIKGMKMPKGCHEAPHGYVCPYLLYCKVNREYVEKTGKAAINKRLDGCPLVEVTEPHGRLVDYEEIEVTTFIDADGEHIETSAPIVGFTKKYFQQEQSKDCISREYMLKLQRELHGWMSNDKNHELWQKIKDAPSVVPSREEPKCGKWLDYLEEGLKWKCSECGSKFTTPWNYCPNCGARMEREEE